MNTVTVENPMATWDVDKSQWPKGPWMDEPDKVQWVDAATEMVCLAVRSPHSGNWCGYVGVPEAHPFYEVEYQDDRLGDIGVHGGLTFSGKCRGRICHVPLEGAGEVWWLGFDCAHLGDSSPNFEFRFGVGRTYRDLAYVQRECADLAAQLAQGGKE